MEVRYCHRGAGGINVRYGDGDCDRDGVSNSMEEANGTDHCVAPPLMGIWTTSSGCSQLSADCVAGEPCTGPATGRCDDAIREGGYLCIPDGEPLYCAPAGWVCPSDTELIEGDPSGDPDWCVPRVCEARYGLVAIDCVMSPEGNMVPWAEGDCDNDNIPNMAEGDGLYCVGLDAGVSMPDAGTADAGTATDASAPTGDAGATVDGGLRIDASTGGTPVDPNFGGGCACRTSPASRNTWWPLLLGLGLALMRRRL